MAAESFNAFEIVGPQKWLLHEEPLATALYVTIDDLLVARHVR